MPAEIRRAHEREATPSMVMIDVQAVKRGRVGPTFHDRRGRGQTGWAGQAGAAGTAPRAFPALTQRMHLQTVSPLPRSRCARSGVSREPDDRGKR